MKQLKNWLMGVIIITTSFAFPQHVERHVRSTGIVTKVPSQALQFYSPHDNDQKIYLSIYGDSLDVRAYKVALFAYYPLDIDPSNSDIRLGFEDGTILLFKQTVYDPVTNYCEYAIPTNGYAKLRYNRFKYLVFEGVAQCSVVQNGDYFEKFLNNYYK